MLDLRQSSKSVKYMSVSEREEARGRLEKHERYELLIQVIFEFLHQGTEPLVIGHRVFKWSLVLS